MKFTPPPPKTSGTAATPSEAELSEDGDLYLEETDESTDSDGNGSTSGKLMAKSPATLRAQGKEFVCLPVGVFAGEWTFPTF